METLISKNKIALLCVTALFLCNTAIAQQTFTVSEKVNVVGNECTKTFTCYYGDNDERIMHGLCKTEGKVKQQEDQYNKYVFSHTENINYSHGKKEGKYFFQQKIYQSHVDVYHDYQINRDKRMRRGWVINTEVTGNYKDDQRDGVWKETIVNRDTLGGEPTKDNKSEKYTYVFSNGKLIELTQPDGTHYTFRYVTKDGNEIPLLSGKNDKYIIKDGIVVSHIVRLNGDESPIDDELKQYIDTKDNLFDYQDELLGKGYVLSEGYRIGYKPYPFCLDMDYRSCIIYILKKVKFATQEDIKKYLADIPEQEFEKKLKKLMEERYIVFPMPQGYAMDVRHIKDSDLNALHPTINRYREMHLQIRTEREKMANLWNKIYAAKKHKNHFDYLLRNYNTHAGDGFCASDSSNLQKRIDKMRACLKMEEDFYEYAIIGEKTKLINAKADSIKSIVGPSSPLWKKYSEIYKEHHEYDFGVFANYLYYNYSPDVNEENFYLFIKDVDNGLIITENCLDYAKAMPLFDTLKKEVVVNPYFNYVKTKYDEVIEVANNDWNGKENGDRLRQFITKMKQIKSHIEALGTIDKNNERIVQLTDKAKKIKKIYTNYFTNIQREYSDNSIEYLNAIINNQNTLIAALEAEEPKEVDKKVKKGDAETMDDIIRILKQK